MRRKTKPVRVGNLILGGANDIVIQSMLNRSSNDIEGSVAQARALEQAGCQIVRAAVPDFDAVRLVGAVKAAVSMPFVADIHFDYRLAIAAVEAGADKIRLNPGNVGGPERVREVVAACRGRGVPIRVGVNSGSCEKRFLERFGGPTPEALVASALYHVGLIEDCGYDQIVVSIKSSDVRRTIACYRLAAEKCDYPLHLGVTEAGTRRMGIVKSAVGIGSLLCDGIGDTIRVSLTADPVEEIYAARDLLRACGLGGKSVDVVSCPTCGRTRVALIPLAEAVERAVEGIRKDVTVAVMGCAVNGPGEAREADLGVACGDGCGLLFCHGEILRKVPEDEILPALLAELERI